MDFPSGPRPYEPPDGPLYPRAEPPFSRPYKPKTKPEEYDTPISFSEDRGRPPDPDPDPDAGQEVLTDKPPEGQEDADDESPEKSVPETPEHLESTADPAATSQDRLAPTRETEIPRQPGQVPDGPAEVGVSPDTAHQWRLVELEDLPSKSVESLGVDIVAAIADTNAFPGAGRLIKVAHQLLIEPHIRGDLVTFDVGRVGFKVHATATPDDLGVELGFGWEQTEKIPTAPDDLVPPARVDWIDAHWEIDHSMPCAVAITVRATLSEVPQPYIDADAIVAFLEKEAKRDKPFAFCWLDPILKIGLLGGNPAEGRPRCSTFAQVGRDGETLRLYTGVAARRS